MSTVKLFLCGDVMTGRGIDQILPHPVAPRLHEAYAQSALDYVELAERASGAIPRPVDYGYVWGDALAVLDRMRPHARIVNLETAVTTSERAAPGKAVHYRMHPRNAPCLVAAKLDCCVLANNHVLDWGRQGLGETLAALHATGIRSAGAGETLEAAVAPAVVSLSPTTRVVVHACALEDSGVPSEWAATPRRSGVALLAGLSPRCVSGIAERIACARKPGDVTVLSIHWGSNWDYGVGAAARAFAHAVIDEAGVDVLHGHSSHHVKGVEIYRGRLVLYGCGDFLNDYEGISGHEEYRPDLALMYFPSLLDGTLVELRAVPTTIARFRIARAAPADCRALAGILSRESAKLDTAVALEPDGTLLFRPA